ncbi:MAG: hypothetical protein D6748_10955 [Calditrichaeota bacterium]|nr:MAG: hypothetical protein D6748_10955 [Calditrichota bacterium]
MAEVVNTTIEDKDAEDTLLIFIPNGSVLCGVENNAAKFDTIDYDHRNLPVRLVNRHGRKGYTTNAA